MVSTVNIVWLIKNRRRRMSPFIKAKASLKTLELAQCPFPLLRRAVQQAGGYCGYRYGLFKWLLSGDLYEATIDHEYESSQ